MKAEQRLALVNRFFQAYNDTDFETIADLISDNLHWEHHNRFEGEGKGKLLDFMRQFAQTVPGRRSTEPTRWAVHGNVIFIEHKLQGTPAVDVAAFGWKAGEPFTLDCCSILVVEDEKIVEWNDYG